MMFISGYFTNQVMSGLHLMYVGKVFVVSSVWCSMLNILYLRLVCLSGLTFSRVSKDRLRDDVCWLHAVFRAKTAGGLGGGVTPSKGLTTCLLGVRMVSFLSEGTLQHNSLAIP